VIKIMTVIGTRPEAIKMAPVVHELARHPSEISTLVCATGQHRDLLGPTLDLFAIRPDRNLDVMVHDQTLAGLTARMFELLDPLVRDERPDWLLVQGDSTTALVGALVGFYRRVRIAHVEAGLRTHDLEQPFLKSSTAGSRICAPICASRPPNGHAPTSCAKGCRLPISTSPATRLWMPSPTWRRDPTTKPSARWPAFRRFRDGCW
jgi:UDP-N-acetylglucosamine 2-epimerase